MILELTVYACVISHTFSVHKINTSKSYVSIKLK